MWDLVVNLAIALPAGLLSLVFIFGTMLAIEWVTSRLARLWEPKEKRCGFEVVMRDDRKV